MKCSKCGAELSDDTRFCSYCGEKIEVNSSDSVDNGVSESDHKETNNQTTFLPEKEKKSIADNIKDRGVGFWNKLSSYEKVTTVALIVFTLMCLIAFIAGKIFAGIIALLSIALTVVALLKKSKEINAQAREITAQIKPLREELSVAKAVLAKIPKLKELLEIERQTENDAIYKTKERGYTR